MLVNLILLVTFLALAFAEKTKGIPALSWQSVAIDASGKYHVAAAAYNNDWDQGYPVYLSDDYGVNWRQSKSSPLDWRNTYSDSTGQVLIGYAVYNSFSSSTTPPLQISKDRGNTWETGSSTSNFPFTSDIIGNTTSLYTVSGSRLYHSTDLAHSWSMITNVPSKQGTAYYSNIAGVALDSTAKFIYTICDGGLCVSHNSGQTYSAYYDLLTNSVQVDSTGQYAFILSDKYLKSSTDYGYTWTTLKDYTVSGAPVVTKTFLRISNDHANVFLLEKPSASSTSTSLIRYSVNSRTSSTLFTTTSTINDVAISASGNSMIVSTTSGLFYTSNNSGYTWSTHDLS